MLFYAFFYIFSRARQMIKELQDSVKQKLTKKKKKHAQKLLEKAMKGKGRKKETGPRDFAALQVRVWLFFWWILHDFDYFDDFARFCFVFWWFFL
jgi:hypothetical protein